MEKKKILIKSNIAASNLLKTLHSLYQSGYFCDVTVHTDQLGSQEDFFVHKAVLAASSNYFKSLFLSNEMLNAKNCRVTLHGVHAEEFVTFLRFVYTTEVEVEMDKLHRIKEVAERLECKDLLEAFEEMKSVKEHVDLSAHSRKHSLWSETDHMKAKEQSELTQILAKPMKRNLWDRKRQAKLTTGYDAIDNKSEHPNKDGAAFATHKDETDRSTGCTEIATTEVPSKDNVSQGKMKTSHPSPGKLVLKESCTALGSMLPDQTEDEKGLNHSETKLRKSPRHSPKVLPYACEKCQLSFHFAKQYQLHMEVQHDTCLIIKHSCNTCDQLFSSCQKLKQHRLSIHSREKRFPCLLCNRKFKHQMGVTDHIQKVHEKKRSPQRCPYCDKLISSKCGLTIHIRTHTGEKPYKCEFCPARFAQRSAFNTHVRKMHELSQEKTLISAYCMLVPPRRRTDITEGGIDVNCKMHYEIPSDDLQRESVTETSQVPEKEFSHSHMLEVTPDTKDEKEAPCDEAGLQEAASVEDGMKGDGDCEVQVGDNSKPEVISSEDDHNSNDQDEGDVDSKDRRKGTKNEITKKSAYIITCTKCVETFLSRKKYIDHCQNVHHSLPGKIYQCDVCSKSFASYNSWKEHSASVHTEDRQFACTLCDATFKRKRDVRTHYMRKHEGRVKRPLCSVCGKILSSRTALVFHMRTHTGEKPYQCSICCSRFAQPSQLKIHTRSHTGEKPYICEDCGACFADKGKLNGHKRTHTGERLFKCDVCEKHFATNEYLKCHKRCHMGAKPYKCNVCGKTFGLRASLAQHSNVHAETPPHFCEQCGKTFTQQGALRRHQRIHTGEKPYKCRACERTFTDMSTLRRHVLIHDRNAHWRSFLIDLTIKKDHNWSKIETLSNICMGEESTSVWSGAQSKPNKSADINGKTTEHVSCNSNIQEADHSLTYL